MNCGIHCYGMLWTPRRTWVRFRKDRSITDYWTRWFGPSLLPWRPLKQSLIKKLGRDANGKVRCRELFKRLFLAIAFILKPPPRCPVHYWMTDHDWKTTRHMNCKIPLVPACPQSRAEKYLARLQTAPGSDSTCKSEGLLFQYPLGTPWRALKASSTIPRKGGCTWANELLLPVQLRGMPMLFQGQKCFPVQTSFPHHLIQSNIVFFRPWL